jgi:hypothetical protein
MAQFSPLRAPDAAVTLMNSHSRRSSPASAAAMIAWTSSTLERAPAPPARRSATPAARCQSPGWAAPHCSTCGPAGTPDAAWPGPSARWTGSVRLPSGPGSSTRSPMASDPRGGAGRSSPARAGARSPHTAVWWSVTGRRSRSASSWRCVVDRRPHPGEAARHARGRGVQRRRGVRLGGHHAGQLLLRLLCGSPGRSRLPCLTLPARCSRVHPHRRRPVGFCWMLPAIVSLQVVVPTST